MSYIAYLYPDRMDNKISSVRPQIGAFDVNKIAGSVLWLKGDDEAYTDVAGTIPAADGESIYRWNDQSEQDNDTFMVYQPSRPIYKVDGLNGHATLVFTKAAQTSLVANNARKFDVETPTLFVVGKITSNTGGNCFCGKGDGSVSDGRHRKLSITPFSAGTNFSYWAGTDAMSGCSAAFTATNWNIIGVRSKWNKRTHLSVNGVETIQTATIDNTSLNTNQFCIGCGFVTGAEFLDGEIAELILYNRILSDRENSGVIDYLATKYAISVTNTAPSAVPARTSATSRSVVN